MGPFLPCVLCDGIRPTSPRVRGLRDVSAPVSLCSGYKLNFPSTSLEPIEPLHIAETPFPNSQASIYTTIMDTTSSRPSSPGSRGANNGQLSTLYNVSALDVIVGMDQPTSHQVLMTPVNFVAFLFSLFLVDLRYSLRRSHTHSEPPRRLPSWLHSLVYRSHPYGGDRVRAGAGDQWHYHSKQRKLLEMEAEEAFQFRNAMLVLLGVVAIGAATGVWYLVIRVFQH